MLFFIIDLLYFFLKLFVVNKKKMASNIVVFPVPFFPIIIVVDGDGFIEKYVIFLTLIREIFSSEFFDISF